MRGVQRPKAAVLPEAALLPAANLVQTPPSQFTHRLQSKQAFFFAQPADGDAPAGHLEAGTQVLLQEALNTQWSWVVDGRGLRVVTAQEGLRKR